MTKREQTAIADVMRRHADGLRRLARRSERYVPVSDALREDIGMADTTNGTDCEWVPRYTKPPKLTKRDLQAQIEDLRADVKRLELLLSQHACDPTRHATPETPCQPSIDPADGWVRS